MDRRIVALALASFAMATETYVYAGHLAVLAADLGVTVAAAGQLAAAFAIVYALTAPFTAGLTASLDRRRVLVVGLLLLGVLNAAAALAPDYGSLILVRVLCGLAAGAVGPAASAAAAALAAPERRGKAMAVVLAGTTVAFVLGIPLGSVVGELFGWRATFLFSGILAFGAAVLIRFVLPPLPGGDRVGLRPLLIVRRPAVLKPLAFTLAGFAATFSVIAYIGPVATRIAGLEGAGVGAMQALIGVGSILGIVAGGALADRADTARFMVLSFLLSAAALGGYSALLAAPPNLPWVATGLLSLAMVAGASALFARTPVIQAGLVAAAPEARSVALALNGSVMFIGQGIGAALGGAVMVAGGIAWIGAAGAVLALIGAWLAMAPRAARAVPQPAE
ncbi:MAG TPA: MFS transporter [Azospirillaceae bacterium]|nr:MFS transporter [Azospirillaceae bacterium]